MSFTPKLLPHEALNLHWARSEKCIGLRNISQIESNRIECLGKPPPNRVKSKIVQVIHSSAIKAILGDHPDLPEMGVVVLGPPKMDTSRVSTLSKWKFCSERTIFRNLTCFFLANAFPPPPNGFGPEWCSESRADFLKLMQKRSETAFGEEWERGEERDNERERERERKKERGVRAR